MRLGIKLDIDFNRDNVYRKLFGSRNVLNYLLSQHIVHVETPIGFETDFTLLEEHIKRCMQAGLHISLHPYSERTPYNPTYFDTTKHNKCLEFHRRCFQAAALYTRDDTEKCVINIHPAADSAALGRMHLLEQSTRFFTWAVKWCREYASNVYPVAELQISPNPDESLFRIGDTYTELELIANQSDCGVCWDFGHAVMNHKRFGLPMKPSTDLLKKIRHVHCHDIAENDHMSLLFNNVPFRVFLRLLKEVGFDDTIILEIPPDRFLDHGGLSALQQSVDTVMKLWEL